YANVAKQLNKVVFNLANLLGAILLLISLSVTFNLAAFVLEAAWGTIAAVGLVVAIRASILQGEREASSERSSPPQFDQESSVSREDLEQMLSDLRSQK